MDTVNKMCCKITLADVSMLISSHSPIPILQSQQSTCMLATPHHVNATDQQLDR